MKEPEDETNIIGHLSEGNGLRLVPVEKRESLLPNSSLKALIDEMKGKRKRKHVRLTFNLRTSVTKASVSGKQK